LVALRVSVVAPALCRRGESAIARERLDGQRGGYRIDALLVHTYNYLPSSVALFKITNCIGQVAKLVGPINDRGDLA
jgi:hypothetical protein